MELRGADFDWDNWAGLPPDQLAQRRGAAAAPLHEPTVTGAPCLDWQRIIGVGSHMPKSSLGSGKLSAARISPAAAQPGDAAGGRSVLSSEAVASLGAPDTRLAPGDVLWDAHGVQEIVVTLPKAPLESAVAHARRAPHPASFPWGWRGMVVHANRARACLITPMFVLMFDYLSTSHPYVLVRDPADSRRSMASSTGSPRSMQRQRKGPTLQALRLIIPHGQLVGICGEVRGKSFCHACSTYTPPTVQGSSPSCPVVYSTAKLGDRPPNTPYNGSPLCTSKGTEPSCGRCSMDPSLA